MTREEFGKLVRRAQAGDAVAIRELRTYADNPRMRREAARQASSKLTRPGRSLLPSQVRSTVRSRHRIDRSTLRQVIEILGITRPIIIRFVKSLTPAARTGEHEFTSKGEHVIRLRDGRPREDTNRTLLHELAHAADADGFRSRFRWKAAYDLDPDGFEGSAIEVARLLTRFKVVT